MLLAVAVEPASPGDHDRDGEQRSVRGEGRVVRLFENEGTRSRDDEVVAAPDFGQVKALAPLPAPGRFP